MLLKLRNRLCFLRDSAYSIEKAILYRLSPISCSSIWFPIVSFLEVVSWICLNRSKSGLMMALAIGIKPSK